MALRPVYCSITEPPFYTEVPVDFTFYSGFSIQQKQRSIKSLHDSFLIHNKDKKVLEVSRKSSSLLGNKLSAFNLTYPFSGKAYPVECLFQGSKVFENGECYQDLYFKKPVEAKKDERLKNSGRIIGFKLGDTDFDSEPKNFFYNWLYINSLVRDDDLARELLDYDSFTDIEFNPKKSINCQAIAVSIYVGLVKSKLLEDALTSPDMFKEIVYKNSKSMDYKQTTIEDFLRL